MTMREGSLKAAKTEARAGGKGKIMFCFCFFIFYFLPDTYSNNFPLYLSFYLSSFDLTYISHMFTHLIRQLR